jgi:hypothetical protein
MISDLTSLGFCSYNGKYRCATGTNGDERTPIELLGWAILEQAVDDLALLCRWGLITPNGQCLPWPQKRKFNGGYWCSVNRPVGTLRGPHDHKQLRAWFNSDYAQEFCDLIGCRLNPREIWQSTLSNNAR